MKKIIKLISIVILIITFTGCDMNTDSMKGITIYTTIYPDKYLIDYLYKDYSKVYSIYPEGVEIDNYELSNRKLKEYSKSDLFVFNSLDNDKDYAVKLINLNKNLKVIDTNMGMKYTYGVEELWLDPTNYLMIAQNIKNGLTEYIENPYLDSDVENNYSSLEYDISKIDATLKDVMNSAKYDTIVVDDDTLKYLEKYNINVISLDDKEEISTNTKDEVKKLINDNKVKYIYSTSKETNDTVKQLIKDTDVETLYFNTMRSVDGEITSSNDNYITIMNNNIDLLKKELYK